MQGCIKTATQSRCTMQRHKWLSLHRCNGTNGCRCTDAATPTTANARMRDSACPKFRTMRNQQSKHDSTTPLHFCPLNKRGIIFGAADEARMLTSNNLYNFSSEVLTNYNNILQNPFKFVILYQKTKKPKEPKDR